MLRPPCVRTPNPPLPDPEPAPGWRCCSTVEDLALDISPLGLFIAAVSVVSSGLQQIFVRTMQQKHKLSAHELLSNTAPAQVGGRASCAGHARPAVRRGQETRRGLDRQGGAVCSGALRGASHKSTPAPRSQANSSIQLPVRPPRRRPGRCCLWGPSLIRW